MEIQSPRSLKPLNPFRPATMKMLLSADGVPIHKIQERIDISKLSSKLQNRYVMVIFGYKNEN